MSDDDTMAAPVVSVRCDACGATGHSADPARWHEKHQRVFVVAADDDDGRRWTIRDCIHVASWMPVALEALQAAVDSHPGRVVRDAGPGRYELVVP